MDGKSSNNKGLETSANSVAMKMSIVMKMLLCESLRCVSAHCITVVGQLTPMDWVLLLSRLCCRIADPLLYNVALSPECGDAFFTRLCPLSL